MTLMLHDAASFHEVPARRRSVEWDYGVHWTEPDPLPGGLRLFGRWRVSWIVDTGELYAQCRDYVEVLGTIPAVGDYPHSSQSGVWSAWKDAQTIERVLEGWAEGFDGKPLTWIKDRLAVHQEQVA